MWLKIEKIVAMSFPSEGIESMYRNHINDVTTLYNLGNTVFSEIPCKPLKISKEKQLLYL